MPSQLFFFLSLSVLGFRGTLVSGFARTKKLSALFEEGGDLHGTYITLTLKEYMKLVEERQIRVGSVLRPGVGALLEKVEAMLAMVRMRINPHQELVGELNATLLSARELAKEPMEAEERKQLARAGEEDGA